MAAAAAFHLLDLTAEAEAADGLHEMKVVEAQEAEQALKPSWQWTVLTSHHCAVPIKGYRRAAPAQFSG
jgi:hypothetical protein